MIARSLRQWLGLLLICFGISISPAQELPVITAAPAGTAHPKSSELLEKLSRMLIKETSVAISPVIGLSYLTLTGDASVEKLKPAIWIVIVLLGATLLKDVGGAFVPGLLKKPLDALDFFQNQGLGAICAALFVPELYQNLYAVLEAAPPQADEETMILAASAGGTILLEWLAMPLAIACFAVVWLLSNCINVLILLSPFSTIDFCLKGVKVTALAVIGGVAALNPYIAAGLSVLIIVFASYLSGKAFRLYWFGMIFASDLITRRHKRFALRGNHCVRAFLDQPIQNVPSRTYGTLRATGRPNTYSFTYRPWQILTPRTIELSYHRPLKLGRGLIHLTIESNETDNDLDTHFHFAPRYNGHQEALSKQLRMEVVDIGLRRGLAYALAWVKSSLRFRRRNPETA